ncbi:MAG: hypothetical protein K0S47_4686 [Herbinix sp.]|jgi:hypothetical protein|nr:hypothetical protein [Herbinix sp.]
MLLNLQLSQAEQKYFSSLYALTGYGKRNLIIENFHEVYGYYEPNIEKTFYLDHWYR